MTKHGKKPPKRPSRKAPAQGRAEGERERDEAFDDLLTWAAEAVAPLQALGEAGTAVLIAGITEPPLFVTLRGGSEPGLLCIADDGDVGDDEPELRCASLFVGFTTPDDLGMPPELFAQLRAAGWPSELFPAVEVTDDEGAERPPEVADLRSLAIVLALLLDAGLRDVGLGQLPSRRAILEPDGDTPPAIVTWLGVPVDGDVFVIDVSLDDVTPPVRRRLAVRGGITQADLHHAIQVAFGWEDAPSDRVDEETTRVDAVLAAGARATYTYDAGDDRVHTVQVVSVAAPVGDEPEVACLAGEGDFELTAIAEHLAELFPPAPALRLG